MMTTPTLLPLTAADLPPLLPELVVIGGAFALLILDLFISNRHKVWTHFLSVAILAVAFAMLLGGVGGQGEVFHGMFIRDNAADVMKTVVVLVSGLTLIYGWSYLRERNLYQGEIAVLVLFATAGMMLLVSAGSLLMVYLGLELLALCSYALVASNRDNKLAAEAGMKYIVLGSLASGLLLYGMSLVYGATGSLHLDVIHAAAAHSDERVLLLTGAVFMLAYSTVSHIGFLLMGVAGGGAAGYSSAMFYAVAYAIMSTAAFGVIVALSRSGFEAESIDDFKGLNARNPWMAGLMLCAMFSLAGIPPFLGFWAKLAVLGAAVNGGLLWLVILGVMSAVVGCFYYLRVVKVMYFDEPVGEPLPRNNDRLLGIVLGVNCVALLLLPVALGPLLAWMRNAFAHLS